MALMSLCPPPTANSYSPRPPASILRVSFPTTNSKGKVSSPRWTSMSSTSSDSGLFWKDDCADAIEDFKKYHVGIKVLTSDNSAVACNVCKDVGIDTEHCITDPELDDIVEDDEKLHGAVERCFVFAKLTPIQKFNIINALKKNGNTVGFLGDGINDALALRGADCGISVDTATALAKDAADFILLEKSLHVITHAIIHGLQTHANTIKYIKMATSSNFGNVFSVLIASAWLPFQPMYVHFLWFFFDFRHPFTDDVK
ncbi:HAD-like domain-containing protein [Lipomyces mesembrius]